MIRYVPRLSVALLLIRGLALCGEAAPEAPVRPALVAVVGAGPSGVIAIAALRDVGINLREVIWVDPEFKVGRLGKYYGSVPANAKAKQFVEFIQMSKSLSSFVSPALEHLYALDPEREYPLSSIIEPLQDFTNYFLQEVRSVRGCLRGLNYHEGVWHIDAGGIQVMAERVILALGSHPREIPYALSSSQQLIALDEALQPQRLREIVTPQDTVAVFGSAHSAVLIMKWLIEAGVGRVINFYRHPLHYPPAEGETRQCTLQGDYLSGIAAVWAREVLDKNPPGNLVRVKNTEASLRAWLPLCSKVIYAAGYERNTLPAITGTTLEEYDPHTGIIGPNLFGMGIAFPELVEHGDGTCTFQIGLRSFMRFAQRMVPEWLRRDIPHAYRLLEDLVTVEVL